MPLRSQAPPGAAARLDSVARHAARLGRAHGESVWPGFRPDTIPLLFVLPTGSLLFHWSGALPPEYTPVVGFAAAWRQAPTQGAASTAGELAGRAVAQVVVRGGNAELLATVFHEAFHVLQGAARPAGRKFGRGENAFSVSSYPIFDEPSETLFALEGRLLAAALAARGKGERHELAQRFVAVRRTRLRALSADFSQFDRQSELNEGLAEYAQVRALELQAEDAALPREWRAEAGTKLAAQGERLAQLTGNVTQSFRLRYYATGPAQARLLDALAGPGWKRELLEGDRYLDEALASATGLDALEQRALTRAAVAFDTAALRREAASAIARLQALRRAQVDSLLAEPGILLELSAAALPGKDFGFCAFDPQNHLQVTPTMQLQTRWWRPCAGRALTSTFNGPSVHDDRLGTVRAVIGAEAELTLTVQGRPVELKDGQTLTAALDVKLVTPRVTVEAAKATLTREGRTLRITPLPSP